MTNAEKQVLLQLVEEIEYLRANLAVVSGIAAGQKHIDLGRAEDAVKQAKSSNRGHYDTLRKTINELS